MTSGNTEHAFNRWIDLVIRAHCPECGARRLRSSWWFATCPLGHGRLVRPVTNTRLVKAGRELRAARREELIESTQGKGGHT